MTIGSFAERSYFGSTGMRAIPSHAIGTPAFSAACSPGNDASQSIATNRRAVTPVAASEISHSLSLIHI